MIISKEVQETIKIIFSEDKEFQEKLLSGDVESIKQVGIIAKKGINPEKIIYAYESNDKNLMKEIYNEAIKQTLIPKLYEDLCLEYYQQMELERKIKKSKTKKIIKRKGKITE